MQASIMLESTLNDKDKMNIHVIRWVIKLIDDANENGDNIIRV